MNFLRARYPERIRWKESRFTFRAEKLKSYFTVRTIFTTITCLMDYVPVEI